MFSGIVETTAAITDVRESDRMLRVHVERPSFFDDLHIGDSICVNGVCLTIEAFDERHMQFSLAAETLQVTGWSAASLLHKKVNVERSLKLNDRIHGHLVTGHVDGVGRVVDRQAAGEATFFHLELPEAIASLVWDKGSVAINGVSLTVNSVKDRQIQVCLIPETLKRTNLGEMKPGDAVNIEGDYLAKALLRSVAGLEALKGANR